MKKQTDLTSFASVVGDSFGSQVDLVENLIGSSHYPSIGGYKERLLMSVLKQYLPRNVAVGTGFVLFPRFPMVEDKAHLIDAHNQSRFSVSRQCDIIVYDNVNYPAVFVDGDFVVVRPESVKAVIEVKGVLDRRSLKKTLESAVDFGVKWKNSKDYYAFQNQNFPEQVPLVSLMAWALKRNRNGVPMLSAASIRDTVCKFYASEMDYQGHKDFPYLEDIFVHNVLRVNQCYSSNSTGTVVCWSSGDGRFLRTTDEGSLQWEGDATISRLLASLHYKTNEAQFNRFFSYADEVGPRARKPSKHDGISTCWQLDEFLDFEEETLHEFDDFEKYRNHRWRQDARIYAESRRNPNSVEQKQTSTRRELEALSSELHIKLHQHSEMTEHLNAQLEAVIAKSIELGIQGTLTLNGVDVDFAANIERIIKENQASALVLARDSEQLFESLDRLDPENIEEAKGFLVKANTQAEEMWDSTRNRIIEMNVAIEALDNIFAQLNHISGDDDGILPDNGADSEK